MANLKIQYWAIERLRHYAGNARHHSEPQLIEIARSIQRFGFTNPLLVDPAGEIIAGHGRAMAADRLGMDKVPVIVLANLSDEEKRALRLADNRIAENSSWDDALLRSELKALQQLEVDTAGLGFNDAEMARLLAEVESFLPDTPYTAPATPAAPPQERAPEPVSTPAEELGSEDADGGEDEPAPPPRQPKASDDEYSVFELVMLHDNKVRLVDVLNEVKLKHHYDKLEDALMHIIREYTR